MAPKTPLAPTLDVSTDIRATPRAVIDAFFDPQALAQWRGAERSVTTPRPLGPYAVAWASDGRDDVLGRLGGVMGGRLVHFEATRGFLLADLYWLPPLGNPIGPMALEVTCRLGMTPDGVPCTKLRVLQNGFEEGPRWRRYYEIIGPEWERALEALKRLVETES